MASLSPASPSPLPTDLARLPPLLAHTQSLGLERDLHRPKRGIPTLALALPCLAGLDPSMPLLDYGNCVVADSREVIVLSCPKAEFHVRQQGLLIVLEGEHVAALQVENLLRDRALAAHRCVGPEGVVPPTPSGCTVGVSLQVGHADGRTIDSPGTAAEPVYWTATDLARGGFFTENPVFGRTNNPWNRERTPGGSSVGVQVVGRRWGEIPLLAIARQLSEIIGPLRHPRGY